MVVENYRPLYPSQVVSQREIINIGGVDVVQCTDADRDVFFGYLADVVDVIHREVGGYEGWWIIGGFGRDAVLQKPDSVVMSPDGKWRDVDILVSSGLSKRLQKAICNSSTPIPVHANMHKLLRINAADDISIELGPIKKSLQSEIFATKLVKPHGVTFPTLPAETLLHLYCLGRRPKGRMRRKDFVNALQLARHILKSPTPGLTHDLYAPFHEFSSLKNGGSVINLSLQMYEWAHRYRESGFNNILPINHHRLRPALECLWDIMVGLERKCSHFRE